MPKSPAATSGPCPSAAEAAGLTERPGTEGAHRLAWWIAGDERRVEALLTGTGEEPAMIDRLLSDELQPAEAMAVRIAHATDGAVRPRDWMRSTVLGWSDEPPFRAA